MSGKRAKVDRKAEREEKAQINAYFDQQAAEFEATIAKGTGFKLFEHMSEAGLVNLKNFIESELDKRFSGIKVGKVQAMVDMLKQSDNA